MATLVLVHGAWHGPWCWERWVGPIEEAGHVPVAVTLPGHDTPGRTRRIWATAGAYVAALRAAIEAARRDHGGPVVVVGHSLGGYVAQRLLVRPDAPPVDGLVLLAAVPPAGVAGVTLRLLRQQPATTLQALVTADIRRVVAGPERARHALFGPATPEATVRATADRLQAESYVAFSTMLLRPPKPGRLTVPVAVVAAEHDGVFTPAEQRSLAARCGVEPVVVAGSGHDLMLDEAWPDALDATLAFVRTRQ